MQNTLQIFEDRKEEINYYYSVIYKIESDEQKNGIIENNNKLIKIMKSNLLLMLYNLVEACVVSGMMQIYENLKNDSCSYNSLINEIQNIWATHEINKIFGQATKKSTYENRVKSIIKNILSGSPIVLTRNVLDISGNLDARKIKKICDNHCIRYSLKTDGESLEEVKQKRNDLAHGDVSFGECSRNLTLKDLEIIKDEVFLFMEGILKGMKQYYDEKGYLK